MPTRICAVGFAGAGTSSPVRAANIRRASCTLFTSGPIVSKVGLSGATPAVDTLPTVGLNPTTPHKADGILIDPPVSDPIATGTSPAATATADPLLEPPGTR